MLKTYSVTPARGTNIYFTDKETEGQEGLTVKEDMLSSDSTANNSGAETTRIN